MKKIEILDYSEVRKCNSCGLEKKKVAFPWRSPKKKAACRVCEFMTEHKLGRVNCTECGHEKPIVAFPQVQERSGRKCRICMNAFRCAAELV